MQNDNVICSLVELTRQRDQMTIRAQLMLTLMEATDAAWIVLCRVVEGGKVEVLDRIPSPSAGKSSEPYPESVFDSAEAFRINPDSPRPVWISDLEPYKAMVFPIDSSRMDSDFVVLFNPQLDGRDERITASILKLYDNFLALVIENSQDSLTGLRNRGAFDREIEEATGALRGLRRRREDAAYQVATYLAMLDIDHFKRINDCFGHLYGDEVLLLFAKIFKESFRQTDKLYRYGGEEFAVIIEDTTDKDVNAMLDRFRQTVAEYEFPQVGHVTVSIGVARIESDCLPSRRVDRAEGALYHAKQNGRNRVICFWDMNQDKEATSAEDSVVLF